MIKFNKDFVKNLPDTYQKQTDSNNDKLLKIAKMSSDTLKTDILDVLNSLDIEQATGKTLDLYGEIVNQPRKSNNDIKYRINIGNNIRILNCDISISHGITSSVCHNLSFTRGLTNITNCNIELQGSNNTNRAVIIDTNGKCSISGSAINILNAHSDISNYLGSFYTNPDTLNNCSINFVDGCVVNFSRINNNHFKGTGTIYIGSRGAVVTGNIFDNATVNSIVTAEQNDEAIIFTNNKLKYACTVSPAGSSIIKDNVVKNF